MSAPKIPNLQEGKLIKDIDFQILMCKEKIRNHRKSIEKIKRMSGMYGPSCIGGIRYSDMPKSGFSHMDFPDAVQAIAKDEEYIERELATIKSLRRRRCNLLRAASALEGLEQLIFIYRIIFSMTQYKAAKTIGISERQLQRVEKQIKETSRVFEL